MMYCYCKISKKGNLYHIYDFMAFSESNHKIEKKVTYIIYMISYYHLSGNHKIVKKGNLFYRSNFGNKKSAVATTAPLQF